MEYAGGGVGAPALAGPSVSTTRHVKLEKESELRVEVGMETHLRLRLVTGTAEIFGTELPPEIWLTFPPQVFTWYGATIELDRTTETDYTADHTPMVSYVNIHAILEGRRNRSKASSSDPDSSQGPRVIVVGPTDSGKCTLSQMPVSWEAKQGWKPTFVDSDIGQGSITIPGCIAATPIEMPIDPVEGIPLEMPLLYFFGHTTPSTNADLYEVLVKEPARTIERHFAGNEVARAGGMVINTMGWIEGVGYELLLHAIDTFNANVVLVLGQEYFYGIANDLSPHSNIASFSDLFVYQIGGGPQAPGSALPIGAEPEADPTRLVLLNVAGFILYHRYQHSEEEDYIAYPVLRGTPEQILDSRNLDMARKLMFLRHLTPSP